METYEMLFDIPEYGNWDYIRRINKGWSADIKFFAKTKSGERILIRVSDALHFDKKSKEYQMIQKYAALGFEMSKPIAFGTCMNGTKVYMILSWVDGEDLEVVLPNLTEKEQYELGKKAGMILKAIHSISVMETDIPAKDKKEKKLKQLASYEESGIRIAEDESTIQYIKNNIDKIWRKPVVYQHGDFHPGNLILTPTHEIGVIDFNRWEVGDPYEEFYKLESFGTKLSVPYCIGQIDAYFNDNVPKNFWETLSVYVAHASLHSIKWAEKFGQNEIDFMVDCCKDAFEHYDNFNNVVPAWYDTNKW
ncbi:phosphotransferase [Clostridium sp. E02]|uniref:aminoglycoside phosphotransferase family protein n=1 Tax=Clostridium sp. E02 TaxID=2487134 RepID=UPI001FA970A2|nr:phosphotransferase [Clostridium sp. E02]